MRPSARPPVRRLTRRNAASSWRPSREAVIAIVSITLLITLPWLASSSPLPSAGENDDGFASYLRGVMASMPDEAIPAPPLSLQPSPMMAPSSVPLFRLASQPQPMLIPASLLTSSMLTRSAPISAATLLDAGTRSLSQSANYAMNKLGYLTWKSKYAAFNLLSAAFQTAKAAVGFGAVGFKLTPEKRRKMVRVAAKVMKKLEQRSPGSLPRGTDHMKLAKRLIDEGVKTTMQNKKNKRKNKRKKMFTRVEDFSPELQTMLGFPPADDDEELSRRQDKQEDRQGDDEADSFDDYGEEKPTTTVEPDEFDFIDDEETSTPKESLDEGLEASADESASDVFGEPEIAVKDLSVSMASDDDPFMLARLFSAPY